MGINIDWKGCGYNFVNVYVLSNRKERRLLWEALLNR